VHDRAQRPESSPQAAHPLVEAGARSLRGRGVPLGDAQRTSAEAALGAPFDHVRVHDDALARALAGATGAHALTVGGDVAFGGRATAGHPDVLGHELAHVVQQRGTPGHGPLAATHAGDAVEQDAAARGGAHGG
jgi:hypothetical protein